MKYVILSHVSETRKSPDWLTPRNHVVWRQIAGGKIYTTTEVRPECGSWYQTIVSHQSSSDSRSIHDYNCVSHFNQPLLLTTRYSKDQFTKISILPRCNKSVNILHKWVSILQWILCRFFFRKINLKLDWRKRSNWVGTIKENCIVCCVWQIS